MPEINIRPAIATDIHQMMALDHNFTSEFVWQMDLNGGDDLINVSFREIHLPRSVQVVYPRDPQLLADQWALRSGFLVALMEDDIVGYIGLSESTSPSTYRTTDLIVTRRLRRQGIGTGLVLAALDWVNAKHSRRLVLEMQLKNIATIKLAQKLGFDFCGYNDHYYANHDIALFFSKWIR